MSIGTSPSSAAAASATVARARADDDLAHVAHVEEAGGAAGVQVLLRMPPGYCTGRS